MKTKIGWISIIAALMISLFWFAAMSQSRSYTPFEVGKRYTLSINGSSIANPVEVIEIYPNGWIKISAQGAFPEMLVNTNVVISACEAP